MNSDCSDSLAKLVVFLFMQGTCFQQQKHVCALSSGHPLCLSGITHTFPSSLKKGFDHCCQAESTHECGNVLQGVGELCELAKSVCDVFIRPMQAEALSHFSKEGNELSRCDDAIRGSWQRMPWHVSVLLHGTNAVQMKGHFCKQTPYFCDYLTASHLMVATQPYNTQPVKTSMQFNNSLQYLSSAYLSHHDQLAVFIFTSVSL